MTRARSPLFEVVLHGPEIPNNTGNIGRTCVATGCRLHLVHPLGFEVSEKACRRAGLDYWPRLAVIEHQDWSAYESWEHVERQSHAPQTPTTWCLSTKAQRPLYDARFRPGDRLVFGSETRGLPAEVLREREATCLVLPMVPLERSLNLATAVCAVVYEGIRQLLASGDCRLDDAGRLMG